MVQLTIPQSLVGSLIDIAQLKDITYYPANHRCAHWAVYSEDQTELLCPCAPAESASVEKLFSAASEILYKNFRHRIENADDIVSFSTQEHEEVSAAQADEVVTGSLPLVPETTISAAVDTPADMMEAPASDDSADTTQTGPIPVPTVPTPLEQAQPVPSHEQPQVPTPGIARTPSPAMFKKKSTLTYTPPRIEEYLQQLRTNQAAQSSAENTTPQPETASSQTPKPAGSQTSASGAQHPAQVYGHTQKTALPSLNDPITKAERTANYRVDPGRLDTFKKDNIDLVTIREVITLGRAERINGWIIRFRHNDYRVDVNTASMTVITALDEFDDFDGRSGTEYSPEAARELLGVPDITACDFTSGAQNYLKTHGGEAFDAMVSAISSPEKVRVNLDWTREYHGSGIQVTISPDNRIVMSIRQSATDTDANGAEDTPENSLESNATVS